MLRLIVVTICIFSFSHRIIAGEHYTEEDFFNALKLQKYSQKERDFFPQYAQNVLVQNPLESIALVYDLFQKGIKMQSDSLIGDCHLILGMLYHRMGIIDKSLESYLFAQQYYNKIGDYMAFAWTQINIGNIYYSQNNFTQALNLYYKSIESFRKPGVEENDIRFGLAVAYNNIALCHRSVNNPKKAIKYHELALKLREEMQYRIGIAHNMGYIGHCYSMLDQYETAWKYYLKATLLLKDTTGYSPSDKKLSISFLGETYGRMALHKTRKTEFSLAEIYYDSAISIYEKLGKNIEIIEAYLDLADLYTAINSPNKALSIAEKALCIADEKEYLNDKQNIYKKLMDLHTKRNDFEKALEYSIKQHELDSLMFSNYIDIALKSTENVVLLQNQTSELKDLKQKELIHALGNSRKNTIIFFLVLVSIMAISLFVAISYFFNLKRRSHNEISVSNRKLLFANEKLKSSEKKLAYANDQLERQNRNLVLSEIRLTELNDTKDKFFSIIAHDLKGPISSLSAGLDMLSTQYERFSDKAKADFLLKLKNSASSLHDLLENLLTWARTQKGEINFKPQNFSIGHLIQYNFNVLNMPASRKELSLETDLPEDFQIKVDENMFNTIIRNLLANAIKFSAPGNKIILGAFKRNNFCEIYVKDFGTGIPEEIKDKIFSLNQNVSIPGTHGEKGTGLGLVLCREFVEKHGGQLKVESELGKGTKFTIRLPERILVKKAIFNAD
ncbi:MAG: tetratricopeptide repeat-containing sensor histidine kinase [Cyclobacteriaceae bacterium]|nr:tetratricopeptide repeat-containing sensor histidine kinase [Cyclobacteriaceae bacterium]